MKIHYEFLADKNGKRNYTDIEVSEELGIVITNLEKDEFNNNRAETRRHESYSDADKRDKLIDKSMDVEADIIKLIEKDALYTALSKLNSIDKKIIYYQYLSEKSLTQRQISEILNISENAVKQRTKYIKSKLRKFLENIL